MRDLANEVKKIVLYLNSLYLKNERKTATEVQKLIEKTVIAIENKSYNLEPLISMFLNQNGKRRLVKSYSDWSVEQVISIYLKRCLDRTFRVTYPNRNEYMHIVFDVVSSIKDMSDFVIVKFDFKDYFNTISSCYVYEKFIRNSKMTRKDRDLFFEFSNSCRFCYAGLNTSNIMAEIIATAFDRVLRQKLKSKGLILFKRYIDDGLLIFNQYISQTECLSLILESIKEIYYDSTIKCNISCKTKLNSNKFKYLAKRTMLNGVKYDFDFLGYKFELTNTKNYTSIKYGITNSKINKYKKQINNIFEDYMLNGELELLRHRIIAFCSRAVYQRNKFNTTIWKVKGFISNYNELRFHKNQLIDSTEDFLKNSITDIASTKSGKLPFFLTANIYETPYQLYNNLFKNKTLLFHEEIGIDRKALKRRCQKIGITTSISHSYDYYVREYLIKVKVGH